MSYCVLPCAIKAPAAPVDDCVHPATITHMIPARVRSELFGSLARYHQAGIALDSGLDQWSAELPGRDRKPFNIMAKLVRAGHTLDEAGLMSGVLLPWEAKLLAVSSVHERMDRVLDNLASYHKRTADWWNRLRVRLLFPGAVLILGWLALPLPQLITGQLSINAYLTHNLLLAVIMILFWYIPGTVGGVILRRLLDLLLRFKTTSKPVWQYYRYRFLGMLAALHDAGVAMFDALPVAVNGCDSALLRKRWWMVVAAVKEGCSVSEALHRYEAIDDKGYALVLSGEASGRLGDMLKHEAQQLEQIVALWIDSLVDWLPRLAYVLVLLLLFFP